MLGAAGSGGAPEGADGGHDWLEVAELKPPDPDPVGLLVAPELVEPVELDDPPESDEPVELDDPPESEEPAELDVPVELEVPVAASELVVGDDVEVAVTGVAACVSVLRASAGSCPVTSTTVMSIHTAKNRAIDPPITRARIRRTRARRSSLSLSPSCLVMAASIGQSRSKGV